MADNLIFPIGFDLEAAVKKAGEDWDKTYADRLEKLIAKRPVRIKLDLEKLEDVKTRLAQLKLEPVTHETKSSIRELARELQTLAKALEAVQKYATARGTASPDAVRASKIRINEERARAQAALAAQRAAKAEDNLASARLRAAKAANIGTAATRNANKAYHEQSSYLQRLTQRMAAYWSVRQVTQFLTSVREVTAEFELQRVSLGAIIQDQQRANQLFSEIKAFALKSPVSILDLTKYTKQLAAYKIGVDELFDTTKRLTDVSVGLNVSLDRVILAYGQVRATGYLRASEIRQFTEMGVPIVEELAAKLSKMHGELVTAADVMELVSKRGISFGLVKEVFDDMTSAGGLFYNMQEKQGNTLFGLWAKLGDAASVMYDEIGNTESVNEGMKGAIQLLTELMRNWKAVANTVAWVVAPTALTAMFTKYALSTSRKKEADLAAAAATKARETAELQLKSATEKGTLADINAANAALEKAKADEIAAQKAATRKGLLVSGFKSVVTSMAMGLGVGLAITAVTTLAYKLFEAYENAHRLSNKLDEIDAERIVVTEQSVRNFEYLADAAIKAADGSKEQKDKLDELHRTFKDMIPVEDMSIENLKRLRNGADSASEGYRGLTDSIREYIAQQQKQKALGAIEEEFGAKRITAMRNLYSWFKEQDLSVEERTRFFASFEKQAQDTSKTLKEQIIAAFNEAGIEGGEKLADSIVKQKGFWNKALDWLGKTQPLMFGTTAASYKAIFPDDGYINDLADATRGYNEEVSGTLSYYKKLEGNVGQYTKYLDEANQHMADFIPAGLKENTFAYQQQVNAEQIRAWGEAIVNALKDENVKIENEWFNIDKDKTFDIADIASIDIKAIKDALGAGHGDIKQLLDKIAQGYNEIVPSDRTVQVLRAKLENISDSTGVSMDKLKNYWMNAGENIEDYAKRIKGSIDDLQNKIKEMNQINADKAALKPGSFLLKGYSEEEIKQANAMLLALQQLFVGLSGFTKSSGGGRGTKSDPRLQNLKEEISLTKKLYDEYHKLEKQIGATKAAEKIQEIYSNTIKTLQDRAGKYGFKFELPFTDENLKSNMQHFIDKMKELQKLRDKKGKPLFPNIGKEIDEAVAQMEDVDLNSLQKALEKKLKELADRISRTKTAKEFYEKILGMTGDYDLAAKVSLSIYGDTGYDLQKQLAEQIRAYFDNENIKVEIPIDVITAENQINYKRLGEFAEQMKEKLGEEPYKAIKKIAEEGQKDLAKTYEGYLKDLEKAKTYADKRVELARTTAAKIRAINADIAAGNIDERVGKATIRGLQDREDREAAKLEYEAFKDTPLYVQMFEDLEHASTSTLEMMKSRLEALSGVWGTALDPTQLKEIQSRMNEIDTQLRERNPFKTLKESYQQYRDAVKSVSLQGAVEKAGAASKDLFEKSKMYGADSTQALAAEKELKVREKIVEIARQINAENKKGQKALDAAAQKANDNLKIKRGELELASAQEQALRDKSTYEDPSQDPKVIAAHEAVEAAKEEVDLAERVAKITTNNAKTAKTLKENFAAAARQVTQFMGMAGDVAHAVADTMEALGGDEEDVQFWNDIGTAIEDLTAGFQGIIDSIMSLNLAGVISNAIGIIPNMVKGFFGLFSAGKVRKANKEIKRQQELLEQLEYTYGRLEKVADKVFGADFVSNMNQQRRLLLAQEQAYMKQYEAEMSKGKKADEDQAQEYLNQARDARDKIADMEGQIAERMTGTDVASAARDFAQAWLEAYASFGSTTDAIKEKFNDMIKNMIVESIMARTVQMALQPMFDKMDEMYKSGASMTDVLGYAFSQAGTLTQQITDGLSVNAQQLEAMGIDIREMYATSDNLKGISKNIASASSEEILQLSGFVNTALYYISPIPRMDENLAQIRAIMERGVTPAISAGTTVATQDYTSILTTANEHLSSLPRMEQHLAGIHTMLSMALRTKGATTGFNAFLNS